MKKSVYSALKTSKFLRPLWRTAEEIDHLRDQPAAAESQEDTGMNEENNRNRNWKNNNGNNIETAAKYESRSDKGGIVEKAQGGDSCRKWIAGWEQYIESAMDGGNGYAIADGDGHGHGDGEKDEAIDGNEDIDIDGDENWEESGNEARGNNGNLQGWRGFQ